MRILVTGSSGLLGKKLVSSLQAAGYEVVCLVRKAKAGSNVLAWDPENGKVPQAKLNGFTAVIHLAGSNIADKRWTSKRKKELFQSRCRDTWLLAHAFARLERPPEIFISASAIGFYGDRGESILTERSSKGSGFLADLCEQWERAPEILKSCGTRVIHARLGSVISRDGGMLRHLLPLFRLGLGAVLGNGTQWMSWIGCDDAIRAFSHLLLTQELTGAVNLTAPQSIRNREFAQSLAKTCKRPIFLRLPAPLLRLFLGEMADELLLASTRVVPEKLMQSGFQFRTPEIASALLQSFEKY